MIAHLTGGRALRGGWLCDVPQVPLPLLPLSVPLQDQWDNAPKPCATNVTRFVTLQEMPGTGQPWKAAQKRKPSALTSVPPT